MPRRLPIDPALARLLAEQRRVATRAQLFAAGVTRGALEHRLGEGVWRELFPSVYLLSDADPTRWQRLRGGLLYVGEDAALDGFDAAAHLGVNLVIPDGRRMQVVDVWGGPARSTEDIWLRRSMQPIVRTIVDGLPCVDLAAALVMSGRRVSRESDVLALLSYGLQQRKLSLEQLCIANSQCPRRGRPRIDRLLDDLSIGARYEGELAFVRLCARSTVLPRPECNVTLRLPDGSERSPDALFRDAAFIHEVVGRRVHEREDLLGATTEREAMLEAAGFAVMSSLPAQIRDNGPAILKRAEAIYLQHRGRGLPAGVVVLDSKITAGSPG